MKALWSMKISLSLATFLRSVTEDQLSCAAVCVREWTQFPRGCLRRAKKFERPGRVSCVRRPSGRAAEVNARSVVNLLRGNIWHIFLTRGHIVKKTPSAKET